MAATQSSPSSLTRCSRKNVTLLMPRNTSASCVRGVHFGFRDRGGAPFVWLARGAQCQGLYQCCGAYVQCSKSTRFARRNCECAQTGKKAGGVAAVADASAPADELLSLRTALGAVEEQQQEVTAQQARLAQLARSLRSRLVDQIERALHPGRAQRSAGGLANKWGAGTAAASRGPTVHVVYVARGPATLSPVLGAMERVSMWSATPERLRFHVMADTGVYVQLEQTPIEMLCKAAAPRLRCGAIRLHNTTDAALRRRFSRLAYSWHSHFRQACRIEVSRD